MTTRIQTNRLVSMIAAACLSIAALASTASAATTSNLRVNSIEITDNGRVYVHLSGNLSGATCTNRDMVYIDSTTTIGRNLLAQMTSAYLGGKLVNVNFTSTCVTNTHTLSWMHMHD